MGPSKFPVSARGHAYVWAPGWTNLPIADHHGLPKKIAIALGHGEATVQVRDTRILLEGVILGSTSGEGKPRTFVVPELGGTPLVLTYAIAIEGRSEGLPAQMGALSETRDRRWVVSFGTKPLEFWRQAMTLPNLFDVRLGAILFTPKEKALELRSQLFRAHQEAERKWRS